MAMGDPSSRTDGLPVRTLIAGLAVVAAVSAVLLGMSATNYAAFGSTIAPLMLMAAVLMVALAFGLLHAAAAGVLALAAHQVLSGTPLSGLHLAGADVPLAAIFIVGVIFAGRYTDISRKRGIQGRLLLEAGQPLSSQASEPALGRFLQRIKLDGPSPSGVSRFEDAQRAFVSMCVVAAGLVAAVLAGDVLGPVAGGLFAIAAVLVVGAVLGGRFGFAAGLFAGVALGQVSSMLTRSAPLEDISAHTLVALLFVGAGWGVGRVADQAQHERRTLRMIMDAGRDFSATRDEAAIRRALLDILASLSVRARVDIAADNTAERMSITPSAGQSGWAPEDPRWRVHPLASDGREVGVVRWRFPGPDNATASLDETARAVADLSASAIVRARLNAEKAEMEFVAQTEHLRLVLLDTVSHHFRSPLAGILGSVTSILGLADDHDAPARRELLLIIKEQTNRLSRYVDNFLSVARLETGAIVPRRTDVALESLIYDVWETFGETGGARRFLQANIDCDTLQTDANLLSQVLGNVLENAIKYSPEGSVVDVKAETVGDQVMIKVSDSGPGVTPNSEERIFERFYRMRGVATPGLGLGLYITRSLVEILGGAVEAHNRTDGRKGLVVTVSLPLRPASNHE